MAIRKRAQDLNSDERLTFRDAVRQMTDDYRHDPDKIQNTYAWYVDFHTNEFEDIHGAPLFLPWHRELLRRFESDLQQVSGIPDLGLPYWDWGTDAALPDPTKSVIWEDDFMGWFDSASNWDWDLRRTLGAGGSLPSKAQIKSLRSDPEYYDTSPWNTVSKNSFRRQVEDFHDGVHAWVGGLMADRLSTADPVFFLHHCFLDKLLADWQALHSSEGYVPV